jgi:WD40 repeat protein
MLRSLVRLTLGFLTLFLAVNSLQAQTLSTCRPSPPMRPNAKPGVGDLNLSRDGKTLIVAAGDGKIRFIDMQTGEVTRTLVGHTNMVYTTVFTADEKLMGSSSRDRTARIWDVASGRELHQLGGFRCSVKAVAFSPGDKMIGASGNDGMLKLWDVKTGNELKSLIHRNSADIDMSIYSFVFSRDGKKIYGANGDGTISEWDVASGREIRAWKAHDSYAYRLRFSPDYKLLASYGDSIVKVWDPATGREVMALAMPTVPGITTFSSSLAFSHDGRLIAASTIGIDPKQNTYVYIRALVWNAKTGEKLFTLEGQKFDIDGLVFTRDDRFLLTGSVDTTIVFWDMKTGQKTRTLTLN